METVDLSRYKVSSVLGTGADYEVRAALDRETGQPVVLKRPKPQMVQRKLHATIEERTERTLQVYRQVGYSIPHISTIIGFTERANHDAYFGEALGQEYRVVVEARAPGVPLVGDPMARITGVPINVVQNLFALFPLAYVGVEAPFMVQQQLLDVEERFHQAGYILLDLRPQNVFLQPATGSITVIDCAALSVVANERESRGSPRPDIHDFYMEMLKFYTTPQQAPVDVQGYRVAYEGRPVVRFEPDLEGMARMFHGVTDPAVREAALLLIETVRRRGYGSFTEFRRDLSAYLKAVEQRIQTLADLPQVRMAWSKALDLLRGDYWRRYLFDPDIDLAPFRSLT